MIDNNLKVHSCIKCDLYRYRRTIVSGRGPIDSKVMLIGEAPGALEDKFGIPFVGNAGQLLRRILRYLFIEPKELYITNIIKCRPPNNRRPTSVEVNNCKEHLFAEITKCKPKIIVLLGNTAFKTFYSNTTRTITQERGKLRIVGKSVILVTFHPSYIIRNKTDDSIVNAFIKDMLLLQKLVKLL